MLPGAPPSLPRHAAFNRPCMSKARSAQQAVLQLAPASARRRLRRRSCCTSSFEAALRSAHPFSLLSISRFTAVCLLSTRAKLYTVMGNPPLPSADCRSLLVPRPRCGTKHRQRFLPACRAG